MANDNDQRERCVPGDGARAIEELEVLIARDTPTRATTTKRTIAEVFAWFRRVRGRR